MGDLWGSILAKGGGYHLASRSLLRYDKGGLGCSRAQVKGPAGLTLGVVFYNMFSLVTSKGIKAKVLS